MPIQKITWGMVFISLMTYISKSHPVSRILGLLRHLNVGASEGLRILLNLIYPKTLLFFITQRFTTQNNKKISHCMNAINILSFYVYKVTRDKIISFPGEGE